MEVVCKLIVFHKPSILRLVLGDNRIDRVIDQFPSMDGFAIFHVGLAFLSQRIRWDAHLDLPVDLPLLVKLGSVVLHDRDVVIEEPRGFGFGMGNQRFLFGELQLERFMQELPEEPFDLLCFFPWPSETKQPIVGVSHIFQASVGWIIGDARWELLCRFSHGTGFLVSSRLFQPHRFVDERFVFGVSLASGSFGVRWDERLFDVLV